MSGGQVKCPMCRRTYATVKRPELRKWMMFDERRGARSSQQRRSNDEPMRRWVVVFEHRLNESNATRTHISEFCDALAKFRSVTLITQADEHTFDSCRSFQYRQLKPLPVWPCTLAALLYSVQVFVMLCRIHLRDGVDAVYVRQRTFDFGPLLFAKLIRVPSLFEFNAAYHAEARMAIRGFPLRKRIVYWALLSFRRIVVDWSACRLATGIVTVTEDLARHFVTEHGFPPCRTKVFPNGVNVSRFSPRDSGISKGHVNLQPLLNYIGFVGNLASWQGLPLLLEGFSMVHEEFPKWRLVIVGGGDEHSAMVDLAHKLGIGTKALFTGQVAYSSVVDYINSFAFGVAPFALNARNAITNVSPLKVFEYLACGKPVLAADFSGIRFVRESGAGELFRPNSIDDFVRQLRTMMSLPPSERCEMGMRGRRLVEREFSWDRIVADIDKFAFASVTGFRRER